MDDVMRRRCSWCGCALDGRGVIHPGQPTTDGMCEPCLARELAALEDDRQNALDCDDHSFGDPIVDDKPRIGVEVEDWDGLGEGDLYVDYSWGDA